MLNTLISNTFFVRPFKQASQCKWRTKIVPTSLAEALRKLAAATSQRIVGIQYLKQKTIRDVCGALCNYTECISMSHSSQTIIKSDIRKEDVAQQRAYSSWLNSPGRKRGFVSTEAGECVPCGREEGRRREWKINVAMMPRV
ncbi:hypothetical protein ALC53_08935 [Atta colombica]|uniref:Uncharacterized protein n=1 Tax=Atta colombica TaxID=520822 RepID=A0A151I227_9HYME|nr:hypothetical protein ALC53_08935 [Atta colombica]